MSTRLNVKIRCKFMPDLHGYRGLPAISQLSGDLPVVPDGAGPAFGIVVEDAGNSEIDVKVLLPI